MRDVWAEVFPTVQDRITSVMRDGVATWDKALMLLLERSGYTEETYHTFSYSPLRGDAGGVEGLMCVVTEETERVISERRLETARALSAALLQAQTFEAVLRGVRVGLGGNQRDFPFCLAHLFGGAAASIEADDARLAAIDWPFDQILAGAGGIRVPLTEAMGELPKGAWDMPPREALIVPITKTGQVSPSGALVLGLNPYRPEDRDILGFAELLAGQIAGAVATADLRASEAAEMERLRDLFEQSPSFMAVLRGPQHRFELVNSRYLQLVAHRNVIGQPVRDALPEVEGQGFFELLDHVFETGEPYIGQSVPIMLQAAPQAPPQPRVLDFVYQPIRGSEGAITGIFVEGIDVTTAHDAVLALKESEAQFRTLAEAMPNQVWTARPDGLLDWFNDQVYAFSGAAPGDLDGDAWAALMHPEDRARTQALWAAALASGETYEAEFRLKRADGVYRWHIARALPRYGETGVVASWIGTNTDIEDQKAAAEALADLNTTLEARVEEQTRERDRLWAMSRDLFLIIGRDGAITRANPAWAAEFGPLAEERAAPRFAAFVHHDDQGLLEQLHRTMKAAAPLAQVEARMCALDGSHRVVSWVFVAVDDHYYASGRDVTEQRRTEEALRQSQKMEAVGQLTGGIAHDFNNLLAGITGSLEMLQVRVGQGRIDAIPRYVDAAQGAAKRAAALTQRLLAFSRRQTLDPRPVNINRLIGDMEELIRRTVGPAVEMEVVGAGGIWATMVDANQLENALLNLCINARDAMPDGGSLTIETSNRTLDDSDAKILELPDGDYVSLSVSDTGGGMTAEVIARAFDPFFTTKPLGEGTGLGLSMIYGFVRQSGGQVRIYSEVGAGATMCLYLPRHFGDADDRDGPALRSRPMVEGQGETVLVIDDEPTVRMLIADVLSDAGYRAIETEDGPAGLRVLESDIRIDLLITDVGLPGGMNGRQVADAGRVGRPDLKVLFITGYAENAVVGNGLLERGMQVITKPFAIEALAEKIREMIDG
jgi:PAS domain S-box-containing protein